MKIDKKTDNQLIAMQQQKPEQHSNKSLNDEVRDIIYYMGMVFICNIIEL